MKRYVLEKLYGGTAITALIRDTETREGIEREIIGYTKAEVVKKLRSEGVKCPAESYKRLINAADEPDIIQLILQLQKLNKELAQWQS